MRNACDIEHDLAAYDAEAHPASQAKTIATPEELADRRLYEGLGVSGRAEKECPLCSVGLPSAGITRCPRCGANIRPERIIVRGEALQRAEAGIPLHAPDCSRAKSQAGRRSGRILGRRKKRR